MYSVGILSGKGKWPEVLTEMLKASGSSVSGWLNPLDSSVLDRQQLIDFSDLIWIPEKMAGGMDEAIQVIRRSRHLSLGFPVVEFMDEAPFMVKLAHEARVQVQVGHPDWYHPVLRSSLLHVDHPQSIRITEFLTEESPEESSKQVFKSMVADLDLALGLSGSSVRRIRPHAARLADGTMLQCEIRVELHNGSVISLIIKKFSHQPERLIEIIQSNGILAIDLLNGNSHLDEHIRNESGLDIKRRILWPHEGHYLDNLNLIIHSEEEVARQCLSFIHALERGRHSLSSLEGGFRALEITRQVETVLGAF